MPRIPNRLLDIVVYLYPSVDEAETGEKTGGTGFLVAVASQTHPWLAYTYAVTNSHVIKEARSPMVRLHHEGRHRDRITRR